MKYYRNPILPGFYPDPSICRVDEDYYLITSSFEYFPGVPIFHSKDLVHWRQIGHVLERPTQLELDQVACSGGIYAPTIRFSQGRFYMITTRTGMPGPNRNFIVTAARAEGPWSEPCWLPDAPGIDPSLFFDDDNRAWCTGNMLPETGEKYPGHRDIWLQELDLATMQLTGTRQVILEMGAMNRAIHVEASHIYAVNGLYYLMVAEGGTGHTHSTAIFRSANLAGPYEINLCNPILTHRQLGRNYPIVNPGHADLVETQNGEWWMVLLASRTYGGYFRNLGRETFLAPVQWEDGWPVVCPGAGRVEFHHVFPGLPEQIGETEPCCDHFDADRLSFAWNMIRTPREKFWSLDERPGFLRLKLRPEQITERVTPAFVGRRQQHINFAARTVMDFLPKGENETAGLVILQNANFHFRLEVFKDNSRPAGH